MRKICTLFVCGILFGVNCSAQQADTVIAYARYKFTHISDTTQPENPIELDMALFLGMQHSCFMNYALAKMINGQGPSFSFSGSVGSMAVSPGTPMAFNPVMANKNYYKDQSASLLSYTVFTGEKVFSVDEKIPAIEWNITPETKEIMGLQCQKATARFRGRDWEAWFASQLPYSNGPWKLGGLPGLILDASDSRKEVIFKFGGFENAGGLKVPLTVPETAVRTTPKEFKQYEEATLRDRAANKGVLSSGSGGGMIVVSGGRIGGGPAQKPRAMNNPIEKTP